MLVQGSHSIAMFAAHALRESNSHVYYIRCTYNNIIRAYNIDDLFHIRSDPPGMVKIVYIVCTGMRNNTGSQLHSFMVKNCSYIGGFFATIFFSA